MIILFDARSTLNVIGGLLQNPDLLVSGSYNMDMEDFPHRFHRIIFSAIYHLYNVEDKSINIMEVDGYISKYKEQYECFLENKGVEYLEAAKKLTDIENYNSSCLSIKKYSLLREAQNQNLNIAEIYDENDEQKMKTFDEMGLDNIVGHFQKKIMLLEQKFVQSNEGIQAGDHLEEQIEEYKEKPEMGCDCGLNSMNYVTFGLRKKYYLFSAKSGEGKTRLQCFFAIQTAIKHKKPTLFITTELDYSEIQAILLSGVSGVNERHIILNQYDEGEEEKVQKAIKKLKDAPLYIVFLPDFTVDSIEYLIKKYILLYKVEYVFFDYIRASMSIISSINKRTGGSNQNHLILMLMSERLKMLSAKYNVGIVSSTQLTFEGYIEGSKSIINSTDVFGKIRGATKEEINKYELDFLNFNMGDKNYRHLFIEIEKNRRGMKDVLIGLCVNLGKIDYQETIVLDKNGEQMTIPKVNYML